MISPIVRHHLVLHAPAVADAIEGLDSAAWDALDPELLALCEARIAMLLAGQPRTPPAVSAATRSRIEALASWPTSPLFGPRERACLAFTEQFTGDVATLTDADAAAALEQLGAPAFYGLVTALLTFDQQQRLALALDALFEGAPA